ncbi:helix-turn-helix domain-containing protein [Tychonema sp. LEGE 06208]|uniref:helix-turn-helix transcriptional regulator n=1 Tax=Tychonema sp. LEGE 06208 TaxID=1828663 RepID=UPI0018821C0D|nr:helix-turn-helix domain-containing protein [Tychonema sp. LEGE 06208]MBE9163196.1 helix-turn-helix domain-containing protein [Tychonema sp. LEGE 06208]
MTSPNEQFTEAARDWDLETLYTDLASAKGKRLTPTEKQHLRGLLCGHSPTEIAETLSKNPKGIAVDFCNTIYQYVKNLVGKADEKVENWRKICEWLEDAGYQTPSSPESESGDCLPIKFSIKKANIILDKNQIIVDINLRIIASSPSEIPIIENLDLNGNN